MAAGREEFFADLREWLTRLNNERPYPTAR